MKWVWIALAVVAGLGVLLALVGAMLPVAHAAASRIRLSAPASAVYAAITDIAALPQWRGLKAVELLPPRGGKRCFREVSKSGPMDLLLEEELPDRRVVMRIVTEGSPFGGTWTYRLEPQGGGCELVITEHGEVYHVVFRALAKLVFGHHATLEAYERALAAKFGEAAAPERVPPDPPPASAK